MITITTNNTNYELTVLNNMPVLIAQWNTSVGTCKDVIEDLDVICDLISELDDSVLNSFEDKYDIDLETIFN